VIAIVGAGAAGLAVAHELQLHGVGSTLLEGDTVGHVWGRHYDRLHLHTLKQVSGLPGMEMPDHYPAFPSGEQVTDYLRAYGRRFQLDVRSGVSVHGAQWNGSSWRLDTTDGPISADVVVAATGIWSTPWQPEIDGLGSFEGQVIHSSEYQNRTTIDGDNVLVIGVGNSGSEIAVELADAGLDVAVSVRSGALFVPRPTSVAISRASAYLLRTLPHHLANAALRAVRRDHADIGLPLPTTCPIDTYPVVGFDLPDAVRAGRVIAVPEVTSVRTDRVIFADRNERVIDSILLATGFRPTLAWLPADVLDLRADGTPVLDASNRSLRHPCLYCVGFDYPDTEGWLQSIGRVAGATAAAIAADVERPDPEEHTIRSVRPARRGRVRTVRR